MGASTRDALVTVLGSGKAGPPFGLLPRTHDGLCFMCDACSEAGSERACIGREGDVNISCGRNDTGLGEPSPR